MRLAKLAVLACAGALLAFPTVAQAAPLVTNIAVGSGPAGVTVDPNTATVYVSNQYSNTVSVISENTGHVIGTIPVGTRPTGISVNPATNKVYVANSGSNSISVINGATNTVSTTITTNVGSNPGPVVAVPYGKIYVGNSTGVVAINSQGWPHVIKTFPIGGVSALTLNPGFRVVYADSGNVVRAISGLYGVLGPQITNGLCGPGALAAYTTGGGSSSPPRTSLYVTQSAPIWWGPNCGYGVRTYVNGRFSRFTQTAMAPTAIAAYGNHVFTTEQGATNGSVTASFNGGQSSIWSVPVGVSPDAIAIDPLRNLVFVANGGSGTVSEL